MVNDLTTFDMLCVFLLQDNNPNNIIIKALNCFLKENISFNINNGVFHIGNLEENRVIDKNNYEFIKDILRRQNLISKPEKETFNPANEAARELIEKVLKAKKERKKLNIKVKEEINLYSIISSIAWKSHIGINSVWDLTIYQAYDAFHRLGLIDQYDKTMNAIYAGTIDIKKINLKDINWAKIIEFKNN